MSQISIDRLLNTKSVEEPTRFTLQDHFNRTAFAMGQKNCLDAQELYLLSGINIRPILPTFKTQDEVLAWWDGVHAEMQDCVDVMLAAQDGRRFYFPQ